MNLKVFDFGGKLPQRAHANDVGADVFAPYDLKINPRETVKIPLGFGLTIPPGFGGFIFPRGSIAAQGLSVSLNPVDPDYTGEVHAVITNMSPETYSISASDRIGQLVIIPCAICNFTTDGVAERGDNGFGSTGK